MLASGEGTSKPLKRTHTECAQPQKLVAPYLGFARYLGCARHSRGMAVCWQRNRTEDEILSPARRLCAPYFALVLFATMAEDRATQTPEVHDALVLPSSGGGAQAARVNPWVAR